MDGKGPFDPGPTPETDLWFLPPEPVTEDMDLPPGPRADRAWLFDPRLWQAAQARHSGELAELAARFGALDERLRSGPPGWRHRLALIEVADLSWWTGERIAMDQLALWVGLRLGAARDDTHGFGPIGEGSDQGQPCGSPAQP